MAVVEWNGNKYEIFTQDLEHRGEEFVSVREVILGPRSEAT
jgi:hypothetical protein